MRPTRQMVPYVSMARAALGPDLFARWLPPAPLSGAAVIMIGSGLLSLLSRTARCGRWQRPASMGLCMGRSEPALIAAQSGLRCCWSSLC